jgi:hypothetical protein
MRSGSDLLETFPNVISSDSFDYKIFIHETCLGNSNNKFQENLSWHGIIDSRAQYQPTAQWLRNIELV